MNKSNRQIVTLFWVICITIVTLGQDVITRNNKKKDPSPVQTMEYQLTKKAENGDVEAMVQLGEHYEKNHTYQKALSWYLMAANNRNPYAMKKTGDLFWYGRGGQKDISMALNWYTKALEVDSSNYLLIDENILNEIGCCYEQGKIVERNTQESMKWWQMSANKGNKDSMFHIGYLYSQKNDYSEALKWYYCAANKGSLSAMLEIGEMFYYGKGIEKDHSKAMEWFLSAAEKGLFNAKYYVGLLYEKGELEERDFNKAMEWYLMSIKDEDHSQAKEAMNNIGLLYKNGKGVEQNYKEAMKWFQKAAEKGQKNAMFNIGVLYKHGQGVGQDYSKAMEWFQKAADDWDGDPKAMINIGELYEEGLEGINKDYNKAKDWYIKASNAGDSYAMYRIGKLYSEGKGVEIDYEEALKWFQKVIDSNDFSSSYLKEEIDKINQTIYEINYSYEDLGLPSGILWSKFNLGSLKPNKSGNFYHALERGKIKDDIQKIGIAEGNIPSFENVQELIQYCKFEEASLNDCKGYKVIGPNGNFIFIPSVGFYSFEKKAMDFEGDPLWISTYNQPGLFPACFKLYRGALNKMSNGLPVKFGDKFPVRLVHNPILDYKKVDWPFNTNLKK